MMFLNIKTLFETYSMNSSEWKRARVFAWMISFLYFNKLLQVPIVVAMEKSDATFTEIIEAFVLVDKMSIQH